MSTDSKNAVLSLVEALNEADQVAAQAVLAPDCRMHCNGHVEATNADDYWTVFSSFHRAMPDLHQEIEQLVVCGDTVAERWTNRGTHLGEFDGYPPTGNRVEFVGTTFFRVVNGRIVEEHNTIDLHALLEQVGGVAGHRTAV